MPPAALLPAGLSQRYEVREELGRGATGTVFLAWDTFAQREVALKIANPQLFRNEPNHHALIRKAWLNEVHMAGSLHHPYIVEVFDAGFGDDGAYLVMEYLPNGTLEPYTTPDNLKTLPEVLEIAHKCASALDYACRTGIVHRDIKPANLQYVGFGEAKVCDFGAAYLSRDDSSTQVMAVGSLAYMAPELFLHHVTPQADIYALGVVLHQLLTGKRPFEAGDHASLMYKILNSERQPLTSFRPDLPASLDTLLDKMLARSLEERFANWPQVLAALTTHCTSASTNNPATEGRPAEAELYDKLRHLPLLGSLNDAQLWELLRISRWQTVKEKTVLVTEGEDDRSCYLLLTGEARVVQQGKVIALLDPGTLFGELAFADETPSVRTATVIAETDGSIGKLAYSQLHTASPELQSKMLKIFFRLATERLKQADERYSRLYRQYAQKSLAH